MKSKPARSPARKAVYAAVTKELVSPKTAAQLLEQTVNAGFNNRAISQTAVHRYAGDMRRENWFADTGETIKLSVADDGTEIVIDGQHRLSAVIHAGVPVPLWFFRYVPVEAYKYIDAGHGRTIENVFQITEGWAANAKVLATAGKLAWIEDKTGDISTHVSIDDAASQGNIAEYVMENYPHLPDLYSTYAESISAIQQGALGGAAWMLFLILRWHALDEELCDEVVEYLAQVARISRAQKRAAAKPGNTKMANSLAALSQPKLPAKGWSLATEFVAACRKKFEDEGIAVEGKAKVLKARNIDLLYLTIRAYTLAWNRCRAGVAFKTKEAFAKEVAAVGRKAGKCQ